MRAGVLPALQEPDVTILIATATVVVVALHSWRAYMWSRDHMDIELCLGPSKSGASSNLLGKIEEDSK